MAGNDLALNTAVAEKTLSRDRGTEPGTFAKRQPTVAMIVTTWPRLSQTFILREFLGLEKLGVKLRIFSIKVPQAEPVHAEVSRIRAPVTYLAFRSSLWPILRANLRMACKRPRRYFATWVLGLSCLRYGNVLHVIRQMLRAGYVAGSLFDTPADRIHAHFATAPGSVAMFVSELTGIPYTIAVHANDIFVKARGRLMRAKVDRADAVVTNNQFNRRYLLSEFGADLSRKLPCIYNGLDLSAFKARSDPRGLPSAPLILSVGRLVEKKGFTYLISALSILRDRGREFRAEIIGAGPEMEKIKVRIARCGLEDRVVLLGAQDQHSTRAAYHRASMFVLPCVVTSNGDRDGIPNVLYEAMASGIPVVSTGVAGIPELIRNGDNGLLAPQSDPTGLAEQIDLLLTNPDLAQRMADAARRTIESQFTIEQSSKKLADLFRTLHEKRRFARRNSQGFSAPQE